MRPSGLRFKRARPALGTLLEITVAGRPHEEAWSLCDAGFAEAARLERVFSFHDPASELSALNRGCAPSPGAELAEVLAFGGELEVRSRGAFRLRPSCTHADPGCSCPIDLGGVAKGFVVDRVFGRLEELGGPAASFVVSAGGDLRCSAAEQVEIRVPGESNEARFRLALDGQAIATSSLAGGKQFVGTAAANYPAPKALAGAGAVTATVVAANCALADALTKVALFAKDIRPEELGAIASWRFDFDGAPLPKGAVP